MKDKITITVLNSRDEVVNTMVWEDANSAKAFLLDLIMEGQSTGQYEVEQLASKPNMYFVLDYEQ